jgi:hypothetical protein
MNDDYLWDRTGEPDKEVQDLEEVLGTLRYQPRPLSLPATTSISRRRSFVPGLAIAATIALLVLAATLWLRFHRAPAPNQVVRQSAPNSNLPLPKSSPRENVEQEAALPKVRPRIPIQHKDSTAVPALAKNQQRHRQLLIREAETARLEREQAAAVKEQLFVALRLTSAKLNVAQRKTQGVPSPGTIRNQHKIG